MKALIAAVSTAAILTAIPAAASAQDASGPGFYGSLGYAHTGIDSGVGDVDLGAIQGRLGARFNQYLGVEGEAAFGIKEDETTIAGVNVDTKLKHQAAIYGVGFLPLSENFDILGRVGYGTQKIKAKAAGFSDSASDESWNFGVGAQYHFDGLNGVRADFTRHEFDDDGHADVWSIAYTRRF